MLSGPKFQRLSQTYGRTDADQKLEVHNLNSFDYLKYKIRQFSIEYSKQRTKRRREHESLLLKRLEHLEEKICEQVACEGELKQYNELKIELESLEEEKAKGAWIRSRLDIIEKDEKKYIFHSLTNRNKCIQKRH